MPDLLISLHSRDLGYLRIAAGLWGLELDSAEVDAAREELADSLLDPELLREIVDSLGPDVRTALDALIVRDGRIPWAEFTRRYGEIREMGPGKRDREQPQLKPASAAEALYYRALLAKAFFDTDRGPQEFAYIPSDLLSLLPRKGGMSSGFAIAPELIGRPASPLERGKEIPADDHILDDATTLLAALRLGIQPPETGVPARVIQELLETAGLVKKSVPQPEPVKAFLEAPRKDALKMLLDAWLESEAFNELRQVPGLAFEGEWQNQPLVTREFILNLLDAIPEGKWWSLPAFVRAVKEKYPDFQRPAGDYDSWFIKRESDNQYLRGFAYWDYVDGNFIKYFITGPLFWLGQVDLAVPEDGKEPTAFRVTNVASRILEAENGKLHVSSQGIVSVPRLVPRVVRYQMSRFGEWEEKKEDEYRYRLTPASLKRAKEQGLKIEHLLPLLAKHSAGIPPTLVKALKRWEVSGIEARIETQVVLRVSRPEILEEMRKSKAARFLGEVLSPTVVIVKPGAQAKVLASLAENGLLAEVEE